MAGKLDGTSTAVWSALIAAQKLGMKQPPCFVWSCQKCLPYGSTTLSENWISFSPLKTQPQFWFPVLSRKLVLGVVHLVNEPLSTATSLPPSTTTGAKGAARRTITAWTKARMGQLLGVVTCPDDGTLTVVPNSFWSVCWMRNWTVSNIYNSRKGSQQISATLLWTSF